MHDAEGDVPVRHRLPPILEGIYASSDSSQSDAYTTGDEAMISEGKLGQCHACILTLSLRRHVTVRDCRNFYSWDNHARHPFCQYERHKKFNGGFNKKKCILSFNKMSWLHLVSNSSHEGVVYRLPASGE